MNALNFIRIGTLPYVIRSYNLCQLPIAFYLCKAMSRETIYEVLIDYLEQRKSAQLDLQSIRRRMEKIGKTEDEIHQLLIEFDDEWDREQLHLHEVKYAKSLFLGGLILAFSIGIVSILSAMNIGPFSRIPFIWYGGVAAGLLLAFKGRNGIRKTKFREKRLKIKYLKW